MGAPTEEGKMAAEQMLPNGKAAKERKKREESNSEITQENVGGCCQGSNGFSCCRDGSLGVNEERKLEKNINAHGKKGLGKASSWIASLEQSDVLAAVAVIGAVATVAVAYSLYKKSG